MQTEEEIGSVVSSDTAVSTVFARGLSYTLFSAKSSLVAYVSVLYGKPYGQFYEGIFLFGYIVFGTTWRHFTGTDARDWNTTRKWKQGYLFHFRFGNPIKNETTSSAQRQLLIINGTKGTHTRFTESSRIIVATIAI